ncbi:MAG: ATP-binding cassette domain-containing protein [Oligoflexia bacterium]|nr:ATP-binding cassette domain-containing protein [Oligoflexia bacterium]
MDERCYLSCSNLVSRDDFGNTVSCEEFSMNKGDLVAIIGEEGKQPGLMLRLLAGMMNIEGGKLNIMGTDFESAPYPDIQRTRALTGFVFETGSLISNLTLFENIALPLRYHYKTLKREYIDRRVNNILCRFGMVDYWYERPANVSLEVRKKCLYCRALVMRPAIVFYHEPFVGLGMKTRSFIKQLMLDLHIKNRVPALMAVSDIDMVYNFVSRFIIMNRGRIYKIINNNDELKRLTIEDPVVRSLIGEVLYVA